MNHLRKEALLVHKALVSHHLELPLKKEKINISIKKNLIAKYIKKILDLLNINEDNNLLDTPNRIAHMYTEEIFSGLNYANFPEINLLNKENEKNKTNRINEIITVNNLLFTSICEHHFLIFDGKVTISYIPQKNRIGFSKISRIVKFFSQRPQIQERLTKQILLALQTLLETNNVAISIDAMHYCVKARGIRDMTSIFTTTSLGGIFKSNKKFRQEFLFAKEHSYK
ncbi:GTP cyclohydrolase I FolE [Candidatus Schneideria nysicola]|uniref:GTP cyclohydrolase I FolE n=1 Tax=Candidatus Schneideria nysicola TaxID=1081631 RepID=UPI001CAA6063|nr:GTP cyclohydrolase I FolE [Candidatus Schneideria nysicola]UAJ66110.1 GTP cyclohydrolase I FolE [Candidatus Schneideria nysicola]